MTYDLVYFATDFSFQHKHPHDYKTFKWDQKPKHLERSSVSFYPSKVKFGLMKQPASEGREIPTSVLQ